VRRILIGGCGYVGTAAADTFHAAGWMVEGWTHSAAAAAQLMAKPYPVIAVDLTQREQVNARVENFDLVIHCASTRGGDLDDYRRLYLEGARNLLDRFIGSTVLFTSSTSVYAQREGEWVTEDSPAQAEHEKARILAETEQLVLGRGGVVARLGAIHGPGRSALLKKFLRGDTVIDPDNDRFTNHIHRDDIATALFLLAETPAGAKAIYNVVDGSPMRRSECCLWLAQKLKRPAPRAGNVPGSVKRGRSNKQVSNAKVRSLGWTPQYPSFAEAMEKSILPSFGL
jgi:nucleoside-diphosphate-sugar epimerase